MNQSDAWHLTAPKPEKLPPPLERAMHAAVFDWSQWASGQYPELKGLFHVPNGELREERTARLLKRMGQKNGVLDFLLPTAHAGYIGLGIELKRKPNKVTPEQQWWLDFLSANGWRTLVAWSSPEAIDELQRYISAPRTVIGHSMVVRS